MSKVIDNNSVFIAAEVGINHNGDMELAEKMILAAKKAGVDGVKFQNYYTEDFVLDKNLIYEYISQGNKVVETQYEMFKRYELTKGQLRFLKDVCTANDLVFFSTPTSKRGIDDLEDIGVELYKNGSDLLVNLDLIRDFARTGKPTVISTGMATVSEIDDAVQAYEQAGGKELLILHCISSYPAPPEDVHLNKIPTLKRTFGYPVGFSDHTEGNAAAVGAVALGACFIEKHFTIDKNLPGPDHRFSSDPAEMTELVSAIRTIEKSMGNSKLMPTQNESYGRKNFRLSCVAAKNLETGMVLSKNDISFSRPSTGLPPKMNEFFIGKRLKRDLKKGDLLKFDCFE